MCSEYPIPEIQLTPLEHTIINLKVILYMQCDYFIVLIKFFL